MKARSDSTLKSRAEQSREFGEKVFEWCNTPSTKDHPGGYKYARAQLAADGIKTSGAALSEFFSWWGLRTAYELAAGNAEHQKELMLRFDPDGVERAEKFGDFCFLQEAIALKDPKTFIALGHLRETRKTRELKQEDLDLQKNRFEFSAAKAALRHVRELKVISANKSLDEEAKVEAVRLRLFGKAPEKK